MICSKSPQSRCCSKLAGLVTQRELIPRVKRLNTNGQEDIAVTSHPSKRNGKQPRWTARDPRRRVRQESPRESSMKRRRGVFSVQTANPVPATVVAHARLPPLLCSRQIKSASVNWTERQNGMGRREGRGGGGGGGAERGLVGGGG